MKKLLIIADMEGIAGIGHDDFWSTIKGHPLYYLKRHLLVEEVNAAITGALNAGLWAEEIVVADWHLTNYNFYQNELPQGVTLVRAGEEKFLKEGAEKVFLVGFHGAVGTPPRLAHSFSYAIKELIIHGSPGGEATMCAYMAGSAGVPVALLSGDEFAISEIRDLGMDTLCIDTKSQSNTISPAQKHEEITRASEEVFTKNIQPLFSPSPFVVKFSFKSASMARHLPKEYFTRREGEYFVIETSTAYEAYEAFHIKVGSYMRSRFLGHRLLSMFERT
ncbi:MAG: M55 family metallopeptidase [Patescibacteria group bacterium]